jgi:3-hydroxybutyryl-CoA dehydrogenase
MALDDTQTVAVIGLGTMGHGIAQTFAAGGYAVRGFDIDPAACASAMARIRTCLQEFVQADLLEPDRIDPILARITICPTEAEAVGPAAFVTEAGIEDLAVKQELLARLEAVASPTAILASNSSTYPISQSGSRLHHRGRAIVTHWFNPPQIVPLVEVVPGPDTLEGTARATVDLMKRIGKRALRLRKELPGFLVNRIQVAIMREVWDLLDQGIASADEIDAAISGSVGFRLAALGPLEIQDFGGLDVMAAVYRNLAPEIRSSTGIPGVVQQLIDEGNYGTKTGKGFHDYSPERLASRQTRRDRIFLALKQLLDAND